MTSRDLRRAALSVLVLLVVAGCSSSGSQPTATTVTKPEGPSLTGTQWVLSDSTDLGVPTTGAAVTAEFDSGMLSGTSGCNRYTTSYQVDGSKLTISAQIAGTRIACPAGPAAVERAYLARLPRVTSYGIKGTTLTLLGAKGALLVYDATDGATAIAGKWTTTSYYTGTAIQSVALGSTLNADFKHDEVSGESGCNSFGGPYVVKGSTIKLGPFRSTLKACTDPALQTQEQQYLAALGLATTYEVTPKTLQLFRVDGGIAATFER